MHESSTTASAPSRMIHAEAVAQAEAMIPALAERAPRAEELRRLPPETVAEAQQAGLGRILTPLRWGGYELGFETAHEVTVALGRGCGSSAWCLGFVNLHAWIVAAGFGEQAQSDIWGAGPDVTIATSFAPMGKPEPVDGGYLLNGDWAWASGIDYAGWIVVGALTPVLGDATPELCLFAVPRADFRIEDTWFNVGLRGTGSNNVVVDGAFVPEHRVIRMADLREGVGLGAATNPGPIYQVPMICGFPSSLVAAALGIARGAYDYWRDWTRDKLATFSGAQVAQQATTQMRLARAAANLDAADALMLRNIALVDAGTPASLEQRARARLYWGHAMQLILRGMDELFAAGGARGLLDGNPIQRAWRDVHAISCHVGLNYDAISELFGRRELGLDRNAADPFF